MPRKNGNTRFHMKVRHHCADCGARIIPFDSFERQTEAPVEKGARAVLLYSYNHRNKEDRLAWCWSCKGWRRAKRLLEDEILAMYQRRRGVYVRDAKAA